MTFAKTKAYSPLHPKNKQRPPPFQGTAFIYPEVEKLIFTVFDERGAGQ
jgi:hypothetical protein